MKIISILFWKISPYIIITTNSSCTKVDKLFPITPERRRMNYRIAITIYIPVTADNFPPSVEFAFLLNLVEGFTSLETNFKSDFLCKMNDFAFSPTTVLGTSGSDFGIVPLMTTSLYFSRESKKFWINPFPIKQFLVYIVVPFKLLLYILMTVTTVKFLRLLIKRR